MRIKSKFVGLVMIVGMVGLGVEAKSAYIPYDIKVDMTPVPIPDPETLPSLEDIGISSISRGGIRIMPLGDSITQGEGDNSTGYRDDLDQLIDPGGSETNFVGSRSSGSFADNHHEGYPGWETGEIEGIVADRLQRYDPHIVLLHIGTNDFYHGKSVAYAIEHLNGIITKTFDYSPNIYLLVAGIIPWTCCDSGKVDQYNHEVYQLVSDWRTKVGDHIRYVDHYDAFVAYPNWASNLMYDRYHPNRDGYAVMARTWYDHLNNLLDIPNQPPTITILEPDGVNDVANGSYTFTWNDADSDDNARISFYYDDNTNPDDGCTLIVSGLSEDDETDAYTWNTSSLPYGNYYLYGVISDGFNSASDYGPGLLTVSHSPFQPGLIPSAKHEALGDESFWLNGAKITAGASQREQEIAQVLADELNRRNPGVGVSVGAGGNILLMLGRGPDQREGYRLSINPSGITIEGRETDGLFWGAMTVVNLSDDGKVTCAKIEDYPAMEFRAIHMNVREPNRDRFFDGNEGKIPTSYYGKSIMYSLDWLKNFARECALLKMNYIVFESDDKVQWRATPDKRHDPSLTPDEVREWCDYALKYNVKICPLVNAPGHAHWYTSHGKEGYGGWDAPGYELDTDDPQVQADFRSIVEDECLWFSAEYVHLAADETGNVEDFLKPLFEVVNQHNKTAIVWSGGANDVAEEFGAIVMKWHYTGEGQSLSPGGIGAGAIFSNSAGQGIMGYDDRSANNYGWGKKVVEGGALGFLTDVWMNYPGPSYEGLWEQIHMASQAKWGPNSKPTDYGLRFAKQFFGVADEGIYDSYDKLYDLKHSGTRSYFYLSARDVANPVKESWIWDPDEYLLKAESLQQAVEPFMGDVKRHQIAIDFLDWYAQFIEFQACTLKYYLDNSRADLRTRAREMAAEVKDGFQNIWGWGMTGQYAIDSWKQVIDSREEELGGYPPQARPFISLIEPDGIDDLTDRSYLITWQDEDVDDDARISLYFDNDTDSSAGLRLIKTNLSEDDETDAYLWDTSAVAEGDYYIYAEITDGNSSASTYSPGPVRIIHPAPFKIECRSPQIAGTEFEVSLLVGEQERPVENLFGLSFILTYSDTESIRVVEPAKDNILIEPNDFLGSDILTVFGIDQVRGEVRIGLSRKEGHGGVTGFGRLARIRFHLLVQAAEKGLVSFGLKDVTATAPDLGVINLRAYGKELSVDNPVVWPGDTNNDGTVNEIDILPIASYWLRVGPPREGASSNWEGQSASIWPDPSALYADANGDGVVDEREIMPIGLNWAQSHPRGPVPTPVRTPLVERVPVRKNPLEAYQTIYQFLRDLPENEATLRMKALLAELIESAEVEFQPAGSSIATSLAQNYPNPANPGTWLPFTLSNPSPVTIRVYNSGGELIRVLELGPQGAGKYITPARAVHWDGRDEEGREVASGVYFYQLRAGDFISTRKMIVHNR
ncbi:MAG: GDSL-type esterase/lipase family protein [bacterium]